VVYEPAELRQQQIQERVQLLRDHLELWRGTPYRRGGNSRRGVDCSGFVQLTFQRLFGRELPRTVDDQVQYGQKVTLSSARPGDLVFFKTGFWGRHVGIYLEDGFFIHASQSQGVTISSLNDEYWHDNYWQIKRMLDDGGQG
jgi:cell wall-associated NlpC family hydrolase